jgi:hypothetical protein
MVAIFAKRTFWLSIYLTIGTIRLTLK